MPTRQARSPSPPHNPLKLGRRTCPFQIILWLTEAQLMGIKPNFPFPVLHGAHRADDRCIISGFIHVIRIEKTTLASLTFTNASQMGNISLVAGSPKRICLGPIRTAGFRLSQDVIPVALLQLVGSPASLNLAQTCRCGSSWVVRKGFRFSMAGSGTGCVKTPLRV